MSMLRCVRGGRASVTVGGVSKHPRVVMLAVWLWDACEAPSHWVGVLQHRCNPAAASVLLWASLVWVQAVSRQLSLLLAPLGCCKLSLHECMCCGLAWCTVCVGCNQLLQSAAGGQRGGSHCCCRHVALLLACAGVCIIEGQQDLRGRVVSRTCQALVRTWLCCCCLLRVGAVTYHVWLVLGSCVCMCICVKVHVRRKASHYSMQVLSLGHVQDTVGCSSERCNTIYDFALFSTGWDIWGSLLGTAYQCAVNGAALATGTRG
jgi:hypothetical protein